MTTRRILMAAMVLLVVAGCSGAKYAEEKTMLSTATKAMETFASAVGSADTPEAVSQALNTFSGALEGLLPAMNKMKEEHAEWEDAPPKELEGEFAEFKSASQKFQAAIPKVMQMAGQNADNADLQNAISKFRSLAAQM